MSRHGEGKTRRKGERPHGAVKAKTMSIPLSEEEAERLHVACFLLEMSASGLLRKAMEQFLAPYKDKIDHLVVEKKRVIVK